eukprot:TRINITY_DN2504_c1_g1_i1.p1 TRINITY_DN2504_c1_g1~~TRINITY_DN2504_c1_g1_i1.p1  ORF type:complete len:282 (+),score=85.65 TRINITY_DN2504_c1_g1_i1:33-878(+)
MAGGGSRNRRGGKRANATGGRNEAVKTSAGPSTLPTKVAPPAEVVEKKEVKEEPVAKPTESPPAPAPALESDVTKDAEPKPTAVENEPPKEKLPEPSAENPPTEEVNEDEKKDEEKVKEVATEEVKEETKPSAKEDEKVNEENKVEEEEKAKEEEKVNEEEKEEKTTEEVKTEEPLSVTPLQVAAEAAPLSGDVSDAQLEQKEEIIDLAAGESKRGLPSSPSPPQSPPRQPSPELSLSAAGFGTAGLLGAYLLSRVAAKSRTPTAAAPQKPAEQTKLQSKL